MTEPSATSGQVASAGWAPSAQEAQPGFSLELLDRSAQSLREACRATAPRERYLKAHLAALRAAAALVGARSRRGEPSRRSLWDALAVLAPELGEWAAYFASSGRRSRLAVRGETAWVGSREADDLVRAAQTFLDLVGRRLGATAPVSGPLRLAPLSH